MAEEEILNENEESGLEEEESTELSLSNMKTLGKQWMVAELARRADFTKEDVHILLDVLESMIYEVVEARGRFRWEALFILTIKSVKSHKTWDFNNNKWYVEPERQRVIIRPSKKLSSLLKLEKYPYDMRKSTDDPNRMKE
jgi:hypothetical protein